MTLPPLNATYNVNRTLLDIRNRTNDLQRQLATGKKSVTYGGLGEQRGLDLSFRGELSQVEGYISSIKHIQVRMNVTNNVLSRVRDISAETKADSLGSLYNPEDTGQTSFQETSRAKFAEMTALMDTQVAGRYIFGGRNTDVVPMLSPDVILDGATGRAGFIEVAQERIQADVGAGDLGRLVIPAPGGAAVSITEDNATSPFGFKWSNASSGLTGTTLAGPAGSPAAVSVTFTATLPNDGEQVSFEFTLPDGTTTTLRLEAVSGTPVLDNQFQIGADENETATNFYNVLNSRIQTLATTELQAASIFAAADNFFDYDDTTPPQRVNGPPYDSATSLVDATTTDTVYWYQGEISSSSARDSAVARIDDTISLSHGVRANEEAFKTVLKQLASVVADTFPQTDANAHDRYLAISSRVNTTLSFNGNVQSVGDITGEFTVIQATLGSALQRHQDNSHLLKSFIDEIEVADTYEVSANLLTLQTRLEATLSVTASLGRISLINFL